MTAKPRNLDGAHFPAIPVTSSGAPTMREPMRALDPREEDVVNRFLLERLTDREEGRQRTLAEYQARYPGFEPLIAREFALDDPPAPEGPDAAAAGAVVGGYRLVAEIGRGGQGSVWRAEDARLGRVVALKLLRGAAAWTPLTLARFRREVELTARLAHPGIAPVFGADTRAGVAWVAMPLYEGETLAEALARRRRTGEPFSPEEAARLVELAARALHAAHAAGIVHRDVKPGNLMLPSEGGLVVLDFGLAQELDGARVTGTGEVFGSPGYMAPEQVEGRRASPATDGWALGVCLHELLALELPFRAPTREALYRRILTESAPRLARAPRDLALVLATALEREPARRYASAEALADDLAAFRARRPVAARPVGPLGRLQRWVEREPRRALVVAGLALALLGLAGTGGYLVARRGELAAGRAALAKEAHAELVRDVVGGFADANTLVRLRELLAEDPTLEAQRAMLAMHLARTDRAHEGLEVLAAAPNGTTSRVLARTRALVLHYAGRTEESLALEAELGEPASELEGVLATVLGSQRITLANAETNYLNAVRALALAPGTSQTTLSLYIQCATMARRVPEAARAAEVLVARWPDSGAAWMQAASPWAFEDMGRARRALERALELEPEVGTIHATYASVLFAENELAAGDAALERALELLQQSTPTLRNALEIAALQNEELGRHARALELAERRLALAPESVGMLLVRARCLRALGRLEDSDEALGRALELEPENAEAQRLLGS
jgi:tetratricopeptide (TPR) repeat protein